MLPTETFADVVSFLAYYDLGALKLANQLCFADAVQCAHEIRLFDFTNLGFFVSGVRIGFTRLDTNWGPHDYPACQLQLPARTTVADFVSEALRNCTLGRLTLETGRSPYRRLDERPETHAMPLASTEHALRSLKAVANTIVVKELRIALGVCENKEELLDTFRRVEKLTHWAVRHITRDEVQVLKDFCERKDIELYT